MCTVHGIERWYIECTVWMLWFCWDYCNEGLVVLLCVALWKEFFAALLCSLVLFLSVSLLSQDFLLKEARGEIIVKTILHDTDFGTFKHRVAVHITVAVLERRNKRGIKLDCQQNCNCMSWNNVFVPSYLTSCTTAATVTTTERPWFPHSHFHVLAGSTIIFLHLELVG